jgi:hypothetical protein
MSNVGLVCIILGWALQFAALLEGDKKISWPFAACNSIGVFLLVVDWYIYGNMTVANLNLLVLILSTCVMIVLAKKTSAPTPSRKRR